MQTTPAQTGEATYCPEDNKLRLYVGRVPREEYEALRAEGWTSTPKQACDFVATWTTQREDTALAYGDGIIGDEDQSPADRAADRAERFAGYRDKRAEEAHGHADTYDAGPQVHGYQSQALAERRAARHDMIATRAVNQWGKAEYWQQRTAGVISHALYVSTPAVRMGRIKELEAEQRKNDKGRAEHRAHWEGWQTVATMPGADELLPLDGNGYPENARMNPAQLLAYKLANGQGGFSMLHPTDDAVNAYGKEVHKYGFYGFSAFDLLTRDSYAGKPFTRLTPKQYADTYLQRAKHPDLYGMRYANHLKLRLAYEMQMLEAQGGRAAFVEMEAGGWIGKHQVQKVNKSPATGRVVSVAVMVTDHGRWGEKQEAAPRLAVLQVERLKADVYRPPTDEERAAFADAKKAAAKERAATAPKGPPLINPTDEDAERLVALWNAKDAADLVKLHGNNAKYYTAREPRKVHRITQAIYSANSSGTYAKCSTVDVMQGGDILPDYYSARSKPHAPVVVKVRVFNGGVIVLTDKPQKAFPAHVWNDQPANVQPELIAAVG